MTHNASKKLKAHLASKNHFLWVLNCFFLFMFHNHNQALGDTHFRPEHAGHGITQQDKDEYLSKASALVVGGEGEEQLDGQKKVKKTK